MRHWLIILSFGPCLCANSVPAYSDSMGANSAQSEYDNAKPWIIKKSDWFPGAIAGHYFENSRVTESQKLKGAQDISLLAIETKEPIPPKGFPPLPLKIDIPSEREYNDHIKLQVRDNPYR